MRSSRTPSARASTSKPAAGQLVSRRLLLGGAPLGRESGPLQRAGSARQLRHRRPCASGRIPAPPNPGPGGARPGRLPQPGWKSWPPGTRNGPQGDPGGHARQLPPPGRTRNAADVKVSVISADRDNEMLQEALESGQAERVGPWIAEPDGCIPGELIGAVGHRPEREPQCGATPVTACSEPGTRNMD